MAAAAAASGSSAGSAPARRRIEQLHFDNLALRALPVDKQTKNFTREVANACFSLVDPAPLKHPQLVCYSPDVLRWIELDESETQRPDFAEYFCGNKVLPGARPAAHCYCGHQFGHFSGQLGDGATMYLGEIITSNNERIEIQFKGAGQTPYSRRADGRKVLRSSLREFLCSEANHYLGIATTRAGTIVTSDTRVIRDINYDGNAIEERATVITRLAPTFLRFGSFEIARGTDAITGRAGPSAGNHALIKQMLDYVVDNFYKDVCAGKESREEQYLAFFEELVRRTAVMVAKWQCVGWCHGVLNTDNMSIAGLTIDYGPFGYMESFDPDFICNGSDNEGRYRYSAQPEICGWNLHKLAQNFEAAKLMPKAALAKLIAGYQGLYEAEWSRIMHRKFGLGVYKPLANASAEEAKALDEKYTELELAFLSSMEKTGSDFTNSFRALSKLVPGDAASYESTLAYLVSQCATISARVAALAPRMPAHQLAMIEQLMRTQPQMFQQPGMEEQMAIIQAELDRKKLRAQVAKQSQAQKEASDRAAWKAWLDQYVQLLGEELQAAQQAQPDQSAAALYEQRRLVQNSANPKYILRNWIAQTIIEAAEKGDYGVVGEALARLRDPYDVNDLGEQQQQQQAAQEQGAASPSSPAVLEEKAQHEKPRPATPERDERAHTNMPPKGTQCALHWNKDRPEWASGLKVT